MCLGGLEKEACTLCDISLILLLLVLGERYGHFMGVLDSIAMIRF